MPVSVTDVRLPELRLPEITREDIVRTLSDVRPPEVPRPDIRIPEVDLSRVDLERAAGAAALAIRASRPVVRVLGPVARVPRLPIALGVVGTVLAVGTVGWWLWHRPGVRARIERSADAARERFEAMRAERDGRSLAVDQDADEDLLVEVVDIPPTFEAGTESAAEPDPFDPLRTAAAV